VLIDTWPVKDSYKFYYCERERIYYSVTKTDISEADMLVVLDEAQMSYHDSGLWLGFIKTQSGKVYALAFSFATVASAYRYSTTGFYL
jgi:hypothetical protein